MVQSHPKGKATIRLANSLRTNLSFLSALSPLLKGRDRWLGPSAASEGRASCHSEGRRRTQKENKAEAILISLPGFQRSGSG